VPDASPSSPIAGFERQAAAAGEPLDGAAIRFFGRRWPARGSEPPHHISIPGKSAQGLSRVATCGYNVEVAFAGIRELKDNLSRYIRRIEAGERIAITAHGRVVAELVPPGSRRKDTPSRFDELVASDVIRAPLEAGDPTEDWPDIRLPPGTAAELIAADRGEA